MSKNSFCVHFKFLYMFLSIIIFPYLCNLFAIYLFCFISVFFVQNKLHTIDNYSMLCCMDLLRLLIFVAK